MVTYLVHMCAPRQLLDDLGLLRFPGVQAFSPGTPGQFLLAPALWVFWLIFLGLPRPFQPIMTPGFLTGCVSLFLIAEATNLLVGMPGVIAGNRKFLLPWVPTMALYYSLGVLAAYKALWELAVNPFSGTRPSTAMLLRNAGALFPASQRILLQSGHESNRDMIPQCFRCCVLVTRDNCIDYALVLTLRNLPSTFCRQ